MPATASVGRTPSEETAPAKVDAKALVRVLSGPVLFLDAAGNIWWINGAVRRFLGLKTDSLNNLLFRDFVCSMFASGDLADWIARDTAEPAPAVVRQGGETVRVTLTGLPTRSGVCVGIAPEEAAPTRVAAVYSVSEPDW
jgi:hypothetical protein